MKEETLGFALNAFEIEAKTIIDTRDHMDWEAFSEAVNAISKTERIGVSGCGHSGIACRHFAHSLCCIERPARFLSPSEAVHGATGFLQKGDVFISASRGGKTAELLPIIEIARKKGATIISITENVESEMAKRSDIVLPMTVRREADRYDTQGTGSFVSLVAIFDALQVAVIEETGYHSDQFALIHPGGAVGERLNS